jgi:hypothetical protein
MFHAATVVKDRYIVIIGGRTERAIVGDVSVFDISSSNWSSKTVTVGERMYHRAVAIGPMIVVIGGMGGQDNGVSLINVLRWELAVCEEFGNSPGAISRYAIVPLSGARFLCFGGTDAIGRIPYACAWALDCEGSLLENSTPPPAAVQKKPKRKLIFSLSFRSESRKEGSGRGSSMMEPAGRKSDPKSRLRVPVTFTIPPPVPPTVPMDIGTKFDVDSILEQLGVSLEGLTVVEQMATKRKVRTFYNARVENQKLDEKLGRLEMIASGKLGLPEGTPLLLKLYDDVTKRTRILRVSSNHSAADLAALAGRACRANAILNVQTSPTSVSVLTKNSLLDAHTSICRGEQGNLVILVL